MHAASRGPSSLLKMQIGFSCFLLSSGAPGPRSAIAVPFTPPEGRGSHNSFCFRPSHPPDLVTKTRAVLWAYARTERFPAGITTPCRQQPPYGHRHLHPLRYPPRAPPAGQQQSPCTSHFCWPDRWHRRWPDCQGLSVPIFTPSKYSMARRGGHAVGSYVKFSHHA